MRVANKEVLCSIILYNIDFKVYTCVLEMLDKSIVYRESMPLLSFKRGIQVIYIVTPGDMYVLSKCTVRKVGSYESPK